MMVLLEFTLEMQVGGSCFLSRLLENLIFLYSGHLYLLLRQEIETFFQFFVVREQKRFVLCHVFYCFIVIFAFFCRKTATESWPVSL